jgi:hypothetical protein
MDNMLDTVLKTTRQNLIMIMKSLLNNLQADISQGGNHDQDETDIPNDTDSEQIAVEHESEIVNPTSPRCLASPYLDMPSGKRRHIDSLFAEFLVSDRARKSIIRTLRARDVTKEESMGSKRPDEEEEERDEDGMIKSGDLGRFLVCLKESRTICLAAGQVLKFRKGKSKQNLWGMHMDDLDSERLAVTVSVQVIDLAPHWDVSGNKIWKWTKEYIQIKGRSTGILTQAHFSVWIPGKNFTPLSITPVYNQQPPVRTIAHQDLDDALTDHWESLEPESLFIFKNLAMIPQLSAKDIRLPYKSPTNEPQFVVKDIPVNAPQLSANKKVPCNICGEFLKIKDMREHVGTHALRTRRLLELDPADKIIEYDHQPMDNLVSFEHSQSLSYKNNTSLAMAPLRRSMWMVRARWMQNRAGVQAPSEKKSNHPLYLRLSLYPRRIHKTVPTYIAIKLHQYGH